MKIFISYTRRVNKTHKPEDNKGHKSEDQIFAESLYEILIKGGYKEVDVFLDTKKIRPDDVFDEVIKYSIIKSDLFIFLVSENSLREDSYALKELEIARAKDITVFPKKISDIDIKNDFLPLSLKENHIEPLMDRDNPFDEILEQVKS